MKANRQPIIKLGRPYKVSLENHVEMIELYDAGEKPPVLALKYHVGLHTIYEYLKLDTLLRGDA